MAEKILILITDLNYGGTEKMVYETARRLDREKFAPAVYGLKGWGIYAEKMTAGGLDVRVAGINKYGKFLMPFLWLKSLYTISKYVKKNQIRLIHSFLFQANVTGRLTGLLCGTPVITSVRVMEEEKKWQLTVERMLSKLPALYTVNSQALKNFLVDKKVCAPEKIEVIYNGIDVSSLPAPDRNRLNAEFNLDKDDFVFATAGRLHRQKGVIHLINAFTGIKKGADKTRCIIVGDGPEKKSLEKAAQGTDKIIFAGRREPYETLRIIASCDVFVLASEWEGTPNVILEAMALGKPVISTDVGGTKELIENGTDGMLVPPGDSRALTDAMEKMLTDKNFPLRLGLKAREKIERRFNMDKMISATENIYERILSGKGRIKNETRKKD